MGRRGESVVRPRAGRVRGRAAPRARSDARATPLGTRRRTARRPQGAAEHRPCGAGRQYASRPANRPRGDGHRGPAARSQSLPRLSNLV
ncbi:hypothetical protein CKO41_01730 [Thiococcus pfennigii]|nr:hypothetical protein [Thiococcus pfennigii]